MVYLIILLFGLVIGSFLNVVIYRTPIHNEIVKRRSHCVFCNHPLGIADLIPLISFVLLRGKCRYCKHPISVRYPLIESGSALLFLSSYFAFGSQPVLWVFNLVTLLVLLVLFCTDILYFRLPNSVILFGGVVTLLFGILGRFSDSSLHILSLDHLLIAGVMYFFVYGIWRYSKGKLIGLGDAKLLAYVGLVFGTVHSILIVYSAVMIGGIVGIILLLLKRASPRSHLPFGSFIALSGMIWIFVGPYIIHYIQTHFFLLL